MYAVIQTGGHQVRVAVGEVVRVARLAEEVGSQVVFDDVLLVGGDHDVKVGTPTIDGAKVATEDLDVAQLYNSIMRKGLSR